MRAFTAFAVALAAILTTSLFSSGNGVFPPAMRCLLVGMALFLAPGYLLSLATDVAPGGSMFERPALLFVSSLALVTPALCWPLLSSSPLTAFVPAFAVIVTLLALVATLKKHPSDPANPAARRQGAGFVGLLALVLLLFCSWAAIELFPVASVDRWWYLAYVRGYMEADELSLAEPFLGSGSVIPRFGFNPWLLALAAWAEFAAVDPVWLYHRICPVVLIPLAFSASAFVGRALFGRQRIAWLFVLSSGLLWCSASLFPLVSRAAEDKIFALVILYPIAAGAFFSAVSDRGQKSTLLLFLAVALLASCHALVYALLLLTLVPFAAALVFGGRLKPTAAIPLAALLLAGGLYAGLNGSRAVSYLSTDGATLEDPSHPVSRIHLSRSRLLELDGGGYVVNPRLLAHPLLVLAICCLPLAFRRGAFERAFLLPATLLPLILAFVPPLARFSGNLISPWMVYRLLWALPFGALLAVGLEAASGKARDLHWIVPLLSVGLILPYGSSRIGMRLDPARRALAYPDEGPLTETMKAISQLPRGAVVASAAELSERIPALTGRRVLAMSDRATVVFSGSREDGEARLSARAGIMSGTWEESPGVPLPSHLLFAGRGPATRYCGEVVFASPGFELCTFKPLPPAEAGTLEKTAPGSVNPSGQYSFSLAAALDNEIPGLVAKCSPQPLIRGSVYRWGKTGPWSPSHPVARCTLRVRAAPDGQGEAMYRFLPRSFRLEAFTGNAVEELTITARASLGNGVTWIRRSRDPVTDGTVLSFLLPGSETKVLEIAITPSYLPFVKLRELVFSTASSPWAP
ncbi:MAG: DUF6077 domain-containing protein [Candidatus Binatia bacterium]